MTRKTLPVQILTASLLWLVIGFVAADLSAPAWYDEGVADWHYRVRVQLAGGTAIDSTAHLDVDFDALLAQMNVDTALVDFDELSVRIVRPTGALATEQEFTDRTYNGLLDPANNGQGEVRFVVEDAVGDYYLYFDIVGNGVKPAVPATLINGNFEHSTGGVPLSWVRSSLSAGGDQNNEVHFTALGSTIDLAAGCSNNAANGLDTSPNSVGATATGQAWHLLGYRDNCEDGNGPERIRLSRDIDVPAGGAAGILEFYFHVQAFDGIQNGGNYDWVRFFVNGATVNHTALNIDNTPLPQLRIDANRLGRNGWSADLLDFGWKRAQLDLSPYAGSTINFRFETRHSTSDNTYRSWVKIDDVVWSRQNATLGTAEAFGANVILPNDTAVAPASIYNPTDLLSVQAIVDASPQSATADVYDATGTPVATGVLLFDDGTHGDVAAGDNVWSNDGSVGTEPTYTFLATDPPGTGWLIRVFAPDASISTAATSGLLLRPGQPVAPEDQVNYFNVDEQVFTLGGARLIPTKSVQALEDPVSSPDAKSIPGAWMQYEVRVVNAGPDATDADTVVLVDDVPIEVAICVLPVCTCVGVACTQLDPVAYDDSASPIPVGLAYSYATDVTYSLDGVDYSYPPSPDSDGFDPAIRHVRIEPTGAMSAPLVAGDAEFVLRYMVRIE